MQQMQHLQLAVPEYRILTHKEVQATEVNSESVPIAYEKNKPDFAAISQQLVALLRRHFSGERIALRLLSSKAHEGLSRQGLMDIIQSTGTDRYDPKRKGDRYDNIDNLPIDFFALDFELGKPEEEICIQHALRSFYYYPLLQGQAPIRVDLGLVYDIQQIQAVPHRYVGREAEIKTDGFIFIEPDNKPKALRAIITLEGAGP